MPTPALLALALAAVLGASPALAQYPSPLDDADYADVEGAADLSITLPASLSGVVRVQALDANSCSVTGVIVP
ncbi:MAG: hypothetical protein ACYTF3_03185 [Planctomycetota bacterium]|jgi:hypothetical protein